MNTNTPSPEPAPSAIIADLNSHQTLTAEQISFLRTNGYIKLKHVFTAETLEFYGREISRWVEELNTQDVPMEKRDTYGKAFLQVMNLWRHSERVKEFVFGKKLARIAAELLEIDGVRLYHDQALYKERGGGVTPWHADQFYWPIDTDRTITAWIPLQATSLEMGPLAFAPQSHRITKGRELGISEKSDEQIEKTMHEARLELDETPFDLGEVSLHLGWTFHRAGPNQSENPREVITIIYMDQNARLIAPKHKNHQADWDAWMPGVKVGEIVDSPINPVLYP